MSMKSFAGAALAALCLVATGCAAVDAPRTPVADLVAQADAVPTPRPSWAPCAEEELRRYECARVAVPLDYARPDGPLLELAVLRQPAGDPARRIGTLFTAAGGPGGSGIDWAAGGEMFPGALSERFDVVTFDQRGVGRSAPVRCFADSTAGADFWRGMTIPPVDDAQRRAVEDNSRALAAGCAEHSGELLAHLTTVDAARDLDLLRRAVGAEQLTFEGGSYASYLGIVYGSLFPDRVRALALSSIVDPVAYTTDTRAHIDTTALGTEEVRAEFLRLCAAAGPQRCAFAGGSPESCAAAGSAPCAFAADALVARDSALLAQAAAAPIRVGDGPGAVSVAYGELVQAYATLLYDPDRGWPALAALLAELERGPAGAPGVVREVLAAVEMSPDFLASFVAMSCADNTFPREPQRWPEFARESATHAPVFGPFWLYLRQPCATWPGPADGYPQRYTGPWAQHSTIPALLINNRFDPATPVASARSAAAAMGTARLVVVNDGYGHQPTGDCVTTLRERYLLDLEVPAADTSCALGRTPFPE
ncbi:alpha/beta fold hydrolase [Nocardia asteroides]|uniref:alpha/beta fold hydrolase n=1 Tax=Nocardia asteroides TaxID=1824 RepID=UPI001E2F8E78|nr:alpha/beta fold hydrolase [Nocardia asteroides]UGT57916.1 alpha/beta hydrolase [Nocardia asteroides]